ncbi:MAG: hypothetical protein CK425_08500 [Parachlamydia sp.]|nr:MAG: hypothetical protein CK425_08500 [Parachlamydia sp.]
MKKNPSYFTFLMVLLILKAFFMLWVISTERIGLGPDEAQYWTWSQSLDWGYYSKPPGIAWQIWLGTKLWGNTELGVRFLAVVMGILLPLLVYRLARVCDLLPRTAFWAGIIMAFSPLGIMGSLLAITDGGMMLFWTAACIILLQAISRQATPSYLLLGTCILLGALFKWPIYIFWLWVLIALIFFPYLRSKQLFVGIALSLVGLLPSVIWNISHRWATFQHVFSTVKGGETQALWQGNLFEFLGAQAVLLSPLLFFCILLALGALFKQRPRDPLWFCGAISVMTLTLFCVYALFKKTQGNWCVFIYPTWIVYLSWFLGENVKWGKAAFKVSMTVSILMSLFGLSIPYAQAEGILSQLQIPYKWNPFRHNVGWQQMTSALTQAGYDSQNNFLLGDRYQMSSLLSFYGPEQKRAYFFNLEGIRKNQFSFWPGMSVERLGETGFFAHVDQAPFTDISTYVEAYTQKLSPYFKRVEFLGSFPLFHAYGVRVKRLLLFKCVSFEGKEPAESNSW